MHRIDTPTAQKDKFGAGKNGFTRGNPQTGVPATDLDDDYFDAIQEELSGLVEGGGLTLDKDDRGQILKALKLLFTANTDSINALSALVGAANKLPYFTGPKAASLTDLTPIGRNIIGKTTIADVLIYLGLGGAAKLDVGATAGTVAAGDDSRITNAIQPSNPGLCTAWVNFNGVGGAVVRSSHNVSSVTRLSAGRYHISFTTPMSNASYVPMLTIGDGGGTGTAAPVVMLTGSVITGEPIKDANSITIGVRGNAQAAYDASEINAVFFGGK